MNVLILAAGFCTRLFPITENFPKALLPVKGKEIISKVLDDVVKNDIGNIALVTNHRYTDIFRVWLKTRYPNRDIQVIDNGIKNPDTRLGAIGDLRYALSRLKWNEDLLVLASDTLASFEISDLFKFFKTHRGIVNTVFDTGDIEVIRKKLGCVLVKGDEIVEFTEKPENPESTLTSIPYYIYPKESLKLIDEYIMSGNSLDAPGSIIPWFIGKIPCYQFRVEGYYYDVGTIEMFNRLNQNAEGI
jgi:glucose-1-phosphate thymidylyltransferase